MDGLECSEVTLSDLEFSGRIDAEYYRKSLLEFENRIILSNHTSLCEVASFLIGPFGSAYDTSNYTTLSNYRYVRGQDVKPFILKDDEPRFIERCDFERLSKYSLKEQDIMVSVVGTLGNTCLVRSKDLPAIFSCKSTVIRTKKLNPYFLIAYLNSKYGSQLLLRKERGAIQKGLNLDDLKSLIVPVFSDILQSAVQKSICNAYNMLDNSKLAYSQAEQILLDELGMADFKPSIEKVAIKNFSDSFGLSGRLDAEYYQTKYEQIEKALFKPQCVEQCCKLFDTNYIPSEKMEYKYIELSNIGIKGDINNVDTIIGIELPSRARRQVKVGQVIVSSIEGSLNSCAIVTQEYHNALCSTGFYVIESDSINSETLLVLFKSPPIQSLMKKRCSGTILTAISKDEFLHLPLPTISLKTQNEIAIKVQESFLLRKKSKELLERAIQAVEMAIEKDEHTAMDWLSSLK